MHAIHRAALFGIAILAPQASAQDLPASDVRIASVQYRGSGCPQGSVATNVSPDAQAMTILFADFTVSTGDRDGRPARKSCDLDINLHVPNGWAFALLGTQVRGFVSVDPGALATQSTTAMVPRGPAQSLGTMAVEGAFSDDYVNSSELPFATLAWSPCGQEATQTLSLSTFISVRPKQRFRNDQGEVDMPQLGRNFPKGLITVDSIDNAIDHFYTFAWKRCDADPRPQGPADVAATCSLRLESQIFNESATGSTPERALADAKIKVLNYCRMVSRGRLGEGESACKPEQVICSVVNKRGVRRR